MTITAPHHIVVIGGGIAGTSTAYYLSTSSARSAETRITLVEGTKIAAGASGYSGGFLAKDWHGSATSSKASTIRDYHPWLTGCKGLAAMSYDLHAKLAQEFGGEKWGYRTVDTLVSSVSP